MVTSCEITQTVLLNFYSPAPVLSHTITIAHIRPLLWIVLKHVQKYPVVILTVQKDYPL